MPAVRTEDEGRPSRASAARTHSPLSWLAAAVLIGFLFWLVAEALLLFFGAVLVAIFLRGLSDWLAGRSSLSRRWSLAIVVLFLVVAVGGVAWLLAPRVAGQIDQLSVTLPASLQRWTQTFEQYQWGRWLLARTDILLQGNGSLLSKLGHLFSFTFGAIIDAALILVIGLYLAAESDRYREGVIQLLPRSRRTRMRQVMSAVARTLRGWLLAQMVSMTFLSVFAFLGLSLLGIPLALTLAIFTGLLTFIPNLGPIISVVPPALLAMAQGPMRTIYVLLLYLILQNVEGYLITPLVQRRAISLPPALLISTQILLALLLGLFGLLLAAPLTALGIVLVKMLYLEDTLGESVSIPGYETPLACPPSKNVS